MFDDGSGSWKVQRLCARSEARSRSGHVVDEVLRFFFFADADVVHGQDHSVVLLRALSVQDVLNGNSLEVVVVGAEHAAHEADRQI